MGWLLLVIQVHFYFKGIFITKKDLSNKSTLYAKQSGQEEPKKVIMMLVDALREDFVEFQGDFETSVSEKERKVARNYLDPKSSVYKGQKMDIFNNLMEDQPENALLLPMESEMPTVTTVRIKAIMTGAMSSVLETREEFAHDEIPEDSIIYQVRKHEPEKERRVVFTGDHIWIDMFGNYFNQQYHYPSFNVRDLETNDIGVHKDLMELLTNGTQFDLLVCHFIGIDHAGHTYYASHSEIERKVLET